MSFVILKRIDLALNIKVVYCVFDSGLCFESNPMVSDTNSSFTGRAAVFLRKIIFVVVSVYT